MTLNEVRGALEQIGLTIPAGTLKRWSTEGLIPKPKRVPRAKGRGMLGDWPPETPEQAAATHYMLHLYRRKRDETAKARDIALSLAKHRKVLDVFDDPEIDRSIALRSAFSWLGQMAKAREGISGETNCEVKIRGLGDGFKFVINPSGYRFQGRGGLLFDGDFFANLDD